MSNFSKYFDHTVHCRLSVLRCQIICKWKVCLCCGQQQAVSALEPQLMLEAAFFRECWMLHWKDVEVSGGYSPPSVFSLSLKDFVLHFYCCSCWPHCINSPNYKIWSSTQVNFFWAHLAQSGSQLDQRICFILPMGTASCMIKEDIFLTANCNIWKAWSSSSFPGVNPSLLQS